MERFEVENHGEERVRSLAGRGDVPCGWWIFAATRFSLRFSRRFSPPFFQFFTLLEFLELPTPVAYSGVALSKFTTVHPRVDLFSHPFFTSCFTTRFPVYHPP